MNKKALTIFGVIAVVIVILGWGYFSYQAGFRAGFNKAKELSEAGKEIEIGNIVASPMEKMPSMNPFDKLTLEH